VLRLLRLACCVCHLLLIRYALLKYAEKKDEK
jgi:hypothetical protein